MEIVSINEAKPAVKRLTPDKVNAQLLNDVQASLTAFQATGMVMFLATAKVALDQMLTLE